MAAYDANVARAFSKAVSSLRPKSILAPVSSFTSDGGEISFWNNTTYVLSQMRNGMTEHQFVTEITHSEDSLILAGAAQNISRSIDYTPALMSIITKMARGQSGHHTHGDLHILPGGVLVCWDSAGMDMLYIERNKQTDPSIQAVDLFPTQATFETCFHAFIPEGANPQEAQNFADYAQTIVPSLILRGVNNSGQPVGDLADRYRACSFRLT